MAHASCTVDADCGDGLCRQIEAPDVCGGVVLGPFSCSTPDDEQNSRHDCADNQLCTPADEGYRCDAWHGGC